MMISDNGKTESKVFQIFEKKQNQNAREDNSLYYQNAFRDLYFSYYQNNPEEAPDFNDASAPQINFNYASQVMYTEDSTRYVLFPVMIDSEVKHIVVASVNAKHDYVSFYFAAHDKIIVNAINEFSTVSRGRPGFDMNNPAPIEEVIISLPTSSSISHIEPFDGMLPPPGGCWVYNNCAGIGGGSGGGGTTPVIQPQQNPCNKTKAMLEKPEVQSAITDLKNHINSGTGGEKGWKFNKNGSTTETTDNGDHSVTVGDPSLVNGTYHNHTGTTLDIFSATDIATLIEIARYQSIGNVGNAFSGLVAPNGIHYVTYFNGNHADLPAVGSYSEIDIKIWEIQMLKLYRKLLKDSAYYNVINGKKIMNSKGLELILFDALKKMGLENKIILQKIEDNNISTINQNQDGTTTPIPCQ